MTPPDSYFRPDTMSEALGLLTVPDIRIAAGCTDLFPATERKILPGPILDITGIRALRGITRHADGITFGATTTWSDIARADLPPAFHGLQAAAREVGALQIQNRGTLAGNLCNASPAADGVPPLLTLDAEVELRSATATRRLPLAAFLIGPRRTDRAPDELLAAVHVPASALDGQGAFLKLGARSYLVISIAMVAARLVIRDGTVAEAALAVGACGPVASRLATLEQALVGAPADAPFTVDPAHLAEALSPIDDVRGDAGYRLKSAAELVSRSIATLMTSARPAR